jgi:hypothetical protein
LNNSDEEFLSNADRARERRVKLYDAGRRARRMKPVWFYEVIPKVEETNPLGMTETPKLQ